MPACPPHRPPRFPSPAACPALQMWADDRHWYPLFIAGHSFVGLFGFTETTTMLWHELRVVKAAGLTAVAAPDVLPPTRV